MAVANDVMCLLCWYDAADGGGVVNNGDVGTESIDEGKWEEKRQLWKW